MGLKFRYFQAVAMLRLGCCVWSEGFRYLATTKQRAVAKKKCEWDPCSRLSIFFNEHLR